MTVGVALIAGFITWMNRRGGCTSRTNRRGRANASPQDFVNDDYAMAEAGTGAAAAGGAAAHNANDPSSPFQNARRFVPPTSGYMNLTDNDQEYSYHNNAAAVAGGAALGAGAAYGVHQGQEYYNQQGGEYYHGSQPDYNQEYQHQQEYHGDYAHQHPEYAQQHGDYGHQEYYDGSANGSVQGGYPQQGYYNNNVTAVAPGSNVTSPTLINDSAVGQQAYHHNKPDQIEQKPNEA